MSSKTVETIYDALNTEPQTPNEIADSLGLHQKTVQSILLELAYERENVKFKKIGRYRMFWREDQIKTTKTTEEREKDA